MKVSIEEVKKIESLSMLSLSEEAEQKMQQDLADVLGHVERLNELDTEGIEPTTYILQQQNVWREDINDVLPKKEEMLKNAPERQDGCFIVPKVVE